MKRGRIKLNVYIDIGASDTFLSRDSALHGIQQLLGNTFPRSNPHVSSVMSIYDPEEEYGRPSG